MRPASPQAAGSARAPRAPDAGITLVEVLVALAISAAIGLAGYTMLDAVLRVGARAEGRLERLREADMAFLVLGRDVLEARARDLRLEEGVLTLPQEGWSAEWSPTGGALVRTILRGAQERVDQSLLSDVSSGSWSVLGPKGWAESWQPRAGVTPPRALRLDITIEGAGLGAVSRLWELAEGAPPPPIAGLR